MNTMIKEEGVEFVTHPLPLTEVENFSHKILEKQVQNHYVNKGLKEDPEHTELFLLTPKEVEEIVKQGLVMVATKKEDNIYTQELVGFAIAVPNGLLVKNPILKKIFEKIGQKEGERVFIVDAFLEKDGGLKNIKTMLKMTAQLERRIIESGPTATVYCPIYSANKNFKMIVEMFGLTFEYGPEQTISTTEIGVIHLPYKILTA